MERPFQAQFCRRHAIAPANYTAELLKRTLYPHARPVAWLLRLWDGHYFQPDFEFIEDISYLRSSAGFTEAMDCYINHPNNRRFLRRRLRLRISGRKMWEEVNAIFPLSTREPLSKLLQQRGSVEPFAPDSRPPIDLRNEQRNEG